MAHIRIFNHYIQSPLILLGAVEFLVLVLSAYIGVIWWGWSVPDGQLFGVNPFVLRYAVVFALVLLVSTIALGCYDGGVEESFTNMAIRLVVSYCLLGSCVIILLFYAVPGFYMGRRPLFASVMLALAGVLALRLVFYKVISAEGVKRKILVLGAGKKAASLASSVGSQFRGFDIVGFVPSSEQQLSVPESLVLDVSGGLDDVIGKYDVDEVVVAVDERRRDRGSYFPIEELLTCKMEGVRITEAVMFYERELGRIELDEVNPGWMVFGNGFRYSRLRNVVKRGFDVLVVLLLFTLTWPLMLLAMLAIVLETGRPVFYKQTRVGLHGELFDIYKFRSMTTDAEKDGRAQWAQENDSRITRVGAFIRNVRIDELPQLWNVLRGDMSFVGPRPERPEFVSEFAEQLPYYNLRHSVKPGLVGWAQLKYPYGASLEDTRSKLVYDLYYVKNYNFLLDLLICVQTVEVVMLGKGVR